MIIAVEGNIGSGKSTQLDLLAKKGYSVHKEPIDEWPLELFYSDPSRYALLFQLAILQTVRVEPGYAGVALCERSLLASRDVFWANLVDTGMARAEEDRVFQTDYEKWKWMPDAVIYVDKDPETCMKHIRERVQKGDGGVTPDYLRKIHDRYEASYRKWDETIPVHVVDGNRSINEIHREFAKIVEHYETRATAGKI